MNAQRLAYVSHPIGYGDEAQRNMTNASAWIRFLVEHTRWALACPWFAYRVILPVELQGRALVDQVTILQRCDLLVICGGAVSPHMEHELTAARRRDIPVVDLTGYGVEPPSWDDVHRENIRQLVADALHAVASGHGQEIHARRSSPEHP